MICSRCFTDTVTWRGPMAALTHTECSSCGGVNCQVAAPDSDDRCAHCGSDGDGCHWVETNDNGEAPCGAPWSEDIE